MKNTLPIFALLIVCFVLGCGKKKSDEKSEGVITYEITYPKMDKKNLMVSFMPKKMEFTFKPNKCKISLSAGMGIFQTSYIANTKKKEVSHLLKFINKKYVSTMNESETNTLLSDLPTYTIEHTSETKRILDYTCQKSIVKTNDGTNSEYTVFHTNELSLKEPNWFNQFREIDGVMLEYEYHQHDIFMKFVATSICFDKRKDVEFAVDEKYVLVSVDQMNDEMEEIFGSL